MGSPLRATLQVGLRSASGLSGEMAPQTEDAEHPQVAQAPAGLQVTLQGSIFLDSAHGSAHEQIVSA